MKKIDMANDIAKDMAKAMLITSRLYGIPTESLLNAMVGNSGVDARIDVTVKVLRTFDLETRG